MHVDKQGIIDGRWRGDMRGIGPIAKDAELWILIWEEFYRVHQEGVRVEVEPLNAHHSKKEVQKMSLFEKFFTEGSGEADELAKEGAMLVVGDMTAGESYHGSAGTRGGLCSFAILASFH